jgi:hypothetical protein
MAEAAFERAHVENPAFVLWSLLHPRESVVRPGEGAARLQDGVALDLSRSARPVPYL